MLVGAEARRALLRDGWRLVRTRGSHEPYDHATKTDFVTLPAHVGRTLAPKAIKSIISQAGLSVEQFINLL